MNSDCRNDKTGTNGLHGEKTSGRDPRRPRTARRRGARCRAARRQAHRGRCAQKGDRALLRYAAQFDGLKDAATLRITPEEMAAAWEAINPALRDALSTAAKQIRAFAKRQLPASWSASHPRPHHRPACSSARLGGLLCSQRPPSVALHAADDCHSRAGGGRRAHRSRLAQTRAGDSCRRAPARHHGVLSPGRRARRSRACLWNCNPSSA